MSRGFDLQAHRGGAGLRPENTLAAFRHALALGVTTLECDVNITADGVAMVTHDRRLDPAKVLDTAPLTPGDPDFPYAGSFVCRLTREQIRTLDCGSLTRPDLPEQQAVPGEPMPTFAEVLALVAPLDDVRVNVEAKFDVLHPSEVAPRAAYVEALLGATEAARLTDRVSVQSFDWEVLRMVGKADARVRRYALTSATTLGTDRPDASPWLGGLGIHEFGDDLVAAVAALGFDAVSPAYHPTVSAELVRRARAEGVLVVPYTVDDPASMAQMLDLGVDGFITDYPDRARTAMASRGMALPGAALPGPGPAPRR